MPLRFYRSRLFCSIRQIENEIVEEIVYSIMKKLLRLTTPSSVRSLSNNLRGFCLLGAVLCGGFGVAWGALFAPADYLQGEYVRIIYLHVPSAILSSVLYGTMALFSAIFLITRLSAFALLCQAIAPIGLLYTALCIVTGSIWGKLSWGAWWVWDARLTSLLVLFFLYIGYFALNDAFSERARARIATSVLVLVGAIDLPIIKFSVEWWYSLHQPASLLRRGGSTIHPEILQPLLLSIVGASFFAAWATFMVYENISLSIRLQRLESSDSA